MNQGNERRKDPEEERGKPEYGIVGGKDGGYIEI
jgi:hypothetical protein